MFLQPASSWQAHINFIYPAAPTVARTLAFIRDIGARAVVVVPALAALTSWWAPQLQTFMDAVLHAETTDEFRITVFGPPRRYPDTHPRHL